MESKNTLWLVLGLVILLVGAYVVWQYVLPALAAGQLDAKKNEAKALYLKSLAMGKDAYSYAYSYEENLGGYIVKTTLINDGPRYKAILESPLAKREIFYMENNTFICVTFNGDEACSPVGTNSELKSYLKGIKGYFFSNARYNADNDTVSFLIDKKALDFISAEKTTVDGKECNNIKYLINYSSLSLTDAVKMGITSSSPTEIYGELCYDPIADETYSKSFTYKRLGKQQFTKWKLLDSNWKYDGVITLEKNITNNTAVSMLYAAVEVQNEFIACLDKGGVASDSCVFSFAINKNYPQVCKYAGTKANFCTMNFAIFNKDIKLCDEIPDAKIRDDCRIEVAGALKNSALCELLDDKSRKQYCLDVISGKVIPIKESNETINETFVPPEDNVTLENRTPEEEQALQDIFNAVDNQNSS